MIWFFTPYSFEKKLYDSYDLYMQTISNPDDWGCLMDGDMAFFNSDFGHHLQEYINKYPDTGLFICYASRSPYEHQVKPGTNPENDSVKYILNNSLKSYSEDHLKIVEQNKRVCAPLLLIQKKTWTAYRNKIGSKCKATNIQAVDSAISDVLMQAGKKILLMAGVNVYHYFRHYVNSEKHILSNKLTVVIRTHSRPKMFERCLNSVLNQTHKNIDILVGADNDESYDYAATCSRAKVIKLTPTAKTASANFPANAYISELLEHIDDGYILILDDDAYIESSTSIEELFKSIDCEWCLFIIRYRYPDGRLFPDNDLFNSKIIQNGGIDWGSFVFHARFRNVHKTLPVYNADFHLATALKQHIKTTKWINLNIVSTDTPGMNGKTEAEINSNYTPLQIAEGEKIDIVYVLGTGSKWLNNELRFSLRALEKYGINVGKIFIVGSKPSYITNDVIHIPATDPFKPELNADGNIAHKVLIACDDPRLSDNFLFINDDHILLKPVAIQNIPPFNRGDMWGWDESQFIQNHWRKRLKRTCDILHERGYTTYDYDCHTPILFNKLKFIEAISLFPIGKGAGLTMKSLYGNVVYGHNGVKLTDQKKTVFRFMDQKSISERLAPCGFMSFNDQGLNTDLKIWLYKRFPRKSQFELTDLQDRYIEIAQWVDSDRNYKAGVALYEKYLKGDNLIKMFRVGESEYLRKKLEYKLIHSITDL